MKKLLMGLVLSLIPFSAYSINTVELNETNHVALVEEVSGNSVSNIILSLEKLSSQDKPTYLYINSPGGSIIDGISLVNYLLSSNKKIICVAQFAASMAHAILESCPERLGTPTNILIQHRASTQASGNTQELTSSLVVLGGLENTLNIMESDRIGIPLYKYKELVNPIWTTYGQQSVDTNRLDGLVNVICSPELYNKSTVTESKSFFGRSTVTKNGCPLLPVTVEEN